MPLSVNPERHLEALFTHNEIQPDIAILKNSPLFSLALVNT